MPKCFCPGSIQPFYGNIIRGSRNDWNREIMPVFADPYWKCWPSAPATTLILGRRLTIFGKSVHYESLESILYMVFPISMTKVATEMKVPSTLKKKKSCSEVYLARIWGSCTSHVSNQVQRTLSNGEFPFDAYDYELATTGLSRNWVTGRNREL